MFLTRCAGDSKKDGVYFTTERVRQVMENNVDRVKVINTGVKAFARCENKGATCDYRIALEGALSTVPFIGARRLHPAREDMEMMLPSEDQDTPPEITSMSDKFREELEKTETGSVAFLFKGNCFDCYDNQKKCIGIIIHRIYSQTQPVPCW